MLTLSERLDDESEAEEREEDAITFELSPGNAHDAPEGRELLRDLGSFPGMPSVVEKDYVLGWILAGTNAHAASTLQLPARLLDPQVHWQHLGILFV